jgi:malonate-semialdehyde dehydrogenase (acetylating)/methylmalonate-semialdehyde dehydrogenase
MSSITIHEVRNYVGDRFEPVSGRETEPVFNPATGDVIAHIPLSTRSDVARAVSAAARAFPAWAATPVTKRVQVLFAYKALLEEHFDELAALVTLENGKDAADAAGEVRRGIEVVDFACGMPTLTMGETVRNAAAGLDNVSYRFPLGVVAAITPFNFPAMVPLWTLPIAIGAGNCYLLKPSERTPLTAQRLVELLIEAGLPPGVIGLVNGGREAVDAILDDPGIEAVSFVGSQPVAEHVYRVGSANGKRVQALGGAKNSMIVMPDAVLDRAVDNIMGSAFGNAGERCLAGSVLVAVGEAGDRVVPAVVAKARAMRVGPGSDTASDLTPVIRAAHRDRIRQYIDGAEAAGATVLLDGREPPIEEGFFLGPTVLDHVTAGMRIAREEVFGPVLSVVRVGTLEQAVEFTNGSPFGNAATIYTESGAAARYFREHVQAGMLGINVGVAAPMAFFPFNGIKTSFYGDLHATGKDGVRFFTENRVEVARWYEHSAGAGTAGSAYESGLS